MGAGACAPSRQALKRASGHLVLGVGMQGRGQGCSESCCVNTWGACVWPCTVGWEAMSTLRAGAGAWREAHLLLAESSLTVEEDITVRSCQENRCGTCIPSPLSPGALRAEARRPPSPCSVVRPEGPRPVLRSSPRGQAWAPADSEAVGDSVENRRINSKVGNARALREPRLWPSPAHLLFFTGLCDERLLWFRVGSCA